MFLNRKYVCLPMTQLFNRNEESVEQAFNVLVEYEN